MSTEAVRLHVWHLAGEDGVLAGPFAQALRAGAGEALRFLPALPRDDAAWIAWMDRAAPGVGSLDPQVATAVAQRQVALQAGPRAVANAQRLAAPDRPTLAVVTGQQPGLLGGPLMTFHKIAGALSLARRLDGLGGHRVVPVFWLAAEDHDFAEANRATLLDTQGQPRVLKLGLAGDGRSIADLAVPRAASEALLEELAAVLPDTERGRAAVALARREGDEDFATWSVRTLLRIFGDSGLVVVEPAVLAPAVGPTLAWLLDHARTICRAVHDSGEALRAAGLPAPLWPQAPDATPLFYRAEPGGRRLRVGLAPDGAVSLRDEPAGFGRADLAARFEADPACGSGNAIGRVFVQNRHLPVLAYVAGPTEIAYHAQVRAAATAVGRTFPLAVPRPEATWTEDKALRGLEAFGRTLGEVVAGAADGPPPPDEALEAALDVLTGHLEAWPAAVEALRARGGSGAAALARALSGLAAEGRKARDRVRAAFEKDAGVDRGRWQRLMNGLRPQGRVQERVLSPLSLVARHGLPAVQAGLAALDPLPPVHHVLALGREEPRS